jgi:hypothetical protein
MQTVSAHRALPKKQISFSTHVVTIDAFDSEEYDRTACQVAELKFKDVFELMQFQIELRKQYAKEGGQVCSDMLESSLEG